MKNVMIVLFALSFLPSLLWGQLFGGNRTTAESIEGYCAGSDRASRPLIGVMSFENKVPGNYYRNSYHYQPIADGMVDALSNALVGTQCFRVVERQRMNDLMQEQNLALYGSVDPSSAAAIGKMSGAQLLVMGTLTEINEFESGGAVGVVLGQLGKKAGIGGLATWNARLSMIIRIVNSTTGEVLVSKSIDKHVSKIGVAAGGQVFGVPMGGGLFKSKAMTQAVEEALIAAAELIVKQKELWRATAETASSSSSPQPGSCALADRADKPSFLVVIPEQHLTRQVPDPAGETEIIRQLVDLGFEVIDPQQIALIRDQERVQAALENNSAAAQLGREFAADIIIIGEAFSQSAGAQNGRQICRARVEARAIETKTGKILTAHGTHATGVDIAEFVAGKDALRNAGGELIQYFLGELCQQESATSAQSGQKVEITLSNADFGKLSKLGRALETLEGVQSVDKSLSGDVARIELSLAGNTELLAEYIYANDLGFPLEIVGFNEHKLDLLAR